MTISMPSNDVQVEFLNLLVLQLQNQDPLEPVKQEQFISQLTEISTLESVEKLNLQFDEMLKVQELGQGASLAGKEVRFLQEGAMQTGTVQEVTFLGGEPEAIISGSSIPLTNILSVVG
ncbi:MAG: flagellar hook capping FlgD N-terminal domain-containing protein [Planctomycetota bacterium]|nr:flagellar hook capping FlgD N-terminal domain-containing protein [Planctomycetota bacterium]